MFWLSLSLSGSWLAIAGIANAHKDSTAIFNFFNVIIVSFIHALLLLNWSVVAYLPGISGKNLLRIFVNGDCDMFF